MSAAGTRYYTKLVVKQYQRPKPFAKIDSAPVYSLYLPLPQELSDRTSVQYTGVDLETVGDAINPGSASAAAVAAAYRYGAPALMSVGSKALQNLLPQTVANAAADMFPAQTVTSAIQMSTGGAPNPNPSVMFKGPSLDDFSYTWTFYPTSPAASRTVKSVVERIKAYALPSNRYGGSAAVLNYPYICRINHYPWDDGGNEDNWGWSSNSIIKKKHCFMRSVNVNYNPAGAPGFFEGTNLPTAIQLSIGFQEIEYMLAEDWGGEAFRGNLTVTQDILDSLTKVVETVSDVANNAAGSTTTSGLGIGAPVYTTGMNIVANGASE